MRDLDLLRIQLTAERERTIAAALIQSATTHLDITLRHPDIAAKVAEQLKLLNDVNTWENNLKQIDILIKLSGATRPETQQHGRTTEQMKKAPQKAVFIWCNQQISYAVNLAESLGRNDLEIVSPMWLTHRRWIGRELTGLVVDHAAELTKDQSMSFMEALARVRIPQVPGQPDQT